MEKRGRNASLEPLRDPKCLNLLDSSLCTLFVSLDALNRHVRGAIAASISTLISNRLLLKEPLEIDLMICVVGSSVAASYNCKGWVSYLADALKGQFTLKNLSQGGFDTKNALQLVSRIPSDACMVIVSLSLPNEGFDLKSFQAGILKLVDSCRKQSPRAVMVLCGPYPCSELNPPLLEMYEILIKWYQSIPESLYIDFWSTMKDSKGHWRPDECTDPYHPNALGQKKMFKCINVEKIIQGASNIKDN